MAKSDVLVRMKADTSSYDANIAKARKTLQGFKQDNLTLGGIMKQSSTAIVSAAAQYASFAAVLGTVATGFATVISEGTAMAREMEGVKMAFDRLNQPGLLDNLREATHGTVNDLELMKNAVKFENFGLSLEQMGTFLAFAQQQAKDTGQSVEYLVDSIVTGLGRKSLPILDNLGLSATEIRERMKETGDMTSAVADIIKERMESAGGYIETASDRAAQAQVRLDNAMMELGNTFQSLTGEASSMWSEIKIGAVNLLNTAIKPLIRALNSLASYTSGKSVEDILTGSMTDVTKYVDDNGRLINPNAINSIPEVVVNGNKPKKNKKGSGSGKSTAKTIREDFLSASRHALAISGEITPIDPVNNPLAFQAYKKYMEATEKDTSKFYKRVTPKDKPNKEKEEDQKLSQTIGELSSGVSSIVGGIQQLGIEIPEGLTRVVGSLQVITSILVGIEALIEVGNFLDIFHAGGVVHAANGFAGTVPGSRYSGDHIPILANAGEVVLTRAMAGNLASQLNGNALADLNLTATVRGEQLKFSLNANGRRTGTGEYVQTNRRRG